ncbi:MAG: ABC transporter permease [Oenococcus sp.]|uniref:ABC transporter permease n=1 Tax=Oenococcus sp. TaxID=1979414 RepID=UPI0039EA9176
MNKTWIVAKHVFLKNLKSPAYYWMLLSPFIFILVGIGIAALVTNSISDNKPSLGVVANRQQVQAIRASLKGQADVRRQDTAAQARKSLSKERIDAYLTVSSDYAKATLVSNNKSDATIDADTVRQAITNLKVQSAISSLNLTAEQVSSLSSPAVINSRYVSVTNGGTSNDNTNRGVRYAFAQFALVAIFIFLTVYVQMTGSEVGTEKGSRILDSILAAVPARQHFAGKVIAIVSLFIFQLIFYAILAVIAVMLAGPFGYARFLNLIDWSQLGSGYIISTSLITIGAIVIYIILAAVFASMVSRQEDVPQSTSTVMWVAIVPYFLGYAALAAANTPIFKIISFVPFFSQSVMPVRMSVGSATTLDGLIAFGLEVVTIAIMLRFASGIYARNALNYDDGKPLAKLLRAFKKRRV